VSVQPVKPTDAPQNKPTQAAARATPSATPPAAAPPSRFYTSSPAIIASTQNPHEASANRNGPPHVTPSNQAPLQPQVANKPVAAPPSATLQTTYKPPATNHPAAVPNSAGNKQAAVVHVAPITPSATSQTAYQPNNNRPIISQNDAGNKQNAVVPTYKSVAPVSQPPATSKAPVGGNPKINALMQWVQRCTQGYAHVNITNFTTSWKDGMAFCALIHHHNPCFDYNALSPNNPKHNLTLAIDLAEKMGIPRLSDPEDYLDIDVPDRLSTITYLFGWSSKLQV
jgi:hypothetical protein